MDLLQLLESSEIRPLGLVESRWPAACRTVLRLGVVCLRRTPVREVDRGRLFGEGTALTMDGTRRRLGDRRGRPRFEIVGQLWGALESVEPLHLHNLSRGGALIESRLPLQPESIHRLRFAYRGQVSDLQARVRHITPLSTASLHDRFLVGVEFISVPPAALSQIDRLVAANLDSPDRAGEGR
jgi:hypothetical protein